MIRIKKGKENSSHRYNFTVLQR